MSTYYHSQIGKMFISLLALIEVWVVGVFAFEFISSGTELLPHLISVVIIFGLLISLFFQLTVLIDETHVRLSFGIGLIRKQWRLDELLTAKPVANKWWWGFGIRFTPHGWLYNIDGLHSVEFQKSNGSTFQIGTDEPDKLIAAFNLAKQAK